MPETNSSNSKSALSNSEQKPKRKRGNPNIKDYAWPKGVSGNPGGRARKPLTLISEAIREKLASEFETDQTYAEKIADNIVKEAAKGIDQWLPAAIQSIDRTEGKAPQAVNINASIEYAADDKLEEIIAKAATRAAAGKAPVDGGGKN